LLRFQKENLIGHRSIGRTKLFHFNIQGQGYTYLELGARSALGKRARDVDVLCEHIEKVTGLYSIVVFGSHATSTQTAKSDLDIAIICNHDLKPAINAASDKTLVKLDAYAFTEKEFLEMLTADYENVGKEIMRKHLPIIGSKAFYRMVMIAQHGSTLSGASTKRA
jgi:predicted nucleotidyltransferase